MASFELCLEALVFAAASAAIYEGSRRLLRDGLARLGLALLVLGLVPPVWEGTSSLRFARSVPLLTRELSAMSAGEPPGGWENAPLPPAERASRSLRGAQIDFMLHGKPGTILDADGRRAPFVPAARDLADREGLVRRQQAAEDAGLRFEDRGVQLLAGACAMMLCGGVVGGAQRWRARRARR